MLITTELTRDVLCNEVIQISNAAKANVMPDIMQHLKIMADILMSPNDFVHVDIPAWSVDLTDIASAVVKSKNHPQE